MPMPAIGVPSGDPDRTFPDGAFLPSRASAVLIGVVGLVGVISFGSIIGIPHVERHLRSDVEARVLGGTDVDVRFDGRIAVLSGAVRSADERRALIDRVARRWGVARVDAQRLTVAVRPKRAQLPPPSTSEASDARKKNRPSVGPSTPPARAAASRAVSTPSTPPARAAASRAVSTPSTPPTTIVVGEAEIGRLETELASIRRSSPITFARSSPTLLPSAEITLDRIAAALAKTPVPIRIEAHTDASGDPGRNAVLSTQRAEAVRAALIVRGINPSIVSAIGRGESTPIASNNSPAGRERNRRVEFVVVRPGVPVSP